MEVKEKVAAFFSYQPIRSYKKGDIILNPGDPVSDVYYVQTGFVRLYCLLADGKELTLNIFKPGSYFPMFLILHTASNLYYFQAMTSVKLFKVSKEAIMRFLQQEPDVLFDFTKRLSIGLNGLLATIQYSLFGAVHSRIISALLLLAKRFGQPQPDGSVLITIHLTHQDIANIIGIARETASLEMEKLTKKKLIRDTQRTITILNISRLGEEALIGDETDITDYTL